MKPVKTLINWGLDVLSDIESDNHEIRYRKEQLMNHTFERLVFNEVFCWISVLLALKAICKDNFGIGCLLVNDNNEMVDYGYNEVFNPYFRSDRHAEMVVLNKFENRTKAKINLKKYTLYTSLEPCPMCFTRIITSGVGKIYYISKDDNSGFTNLKNKLPPVWMELSQEQKFEEADCSDRLKNISFKIFEINAAILNKKLQI